MQEEIVATLASGGIENPRLEARMILSHTKNANRIKDIVAKRIKGMPLDKILGKKAFYKSEFYVNTSVLSPRPETEILVEKAIEIIKEQRPKASKKTHMPIEIDFRKLLSRHKTVSKEESYKILDLGIGSGNILLSILKEIPDVVGIGVDKSSDALRVARENAKGLIKGYESRITFFQADWFAASFFKGKHWFMAHGFDMVVSNPPYIPHEDIDTLEKEVRDYDPLLALDGGLDGLRSYKRIAELAPSFIKTGGYILLEIGINQADDVIGIFQGNGLELVEVLKDLAGIDRCLVFKNRERRP